MEFASYARQAVVLANADLDSLDALRGELVDLPWYVDRVTEHDLHILRRTQPRLRAIFELGAASDDDAAVAELNALLAETPVSPRVSGHDSSSWHLHVTGPGTRPAQDLLAESLMGLAITVIDHGAHRLGVCACDDCDDVYIDTSPNRSRRYCSDRCSSRANVAAFRARQKVRL